MIPVFSSKTKFLCKFPLDPTSSSYNKSCKMKDECSYLEHIDCLHKSILKHILQDGSIDVFLSRCEAFASSSSISTCRLNISMIVVGNLWHMILIISLIWILIVLVLTMIPARLRVMLLMIFHIWMIRAKAVIIYLFLK